MAKFLRRVAQYGFSSKREELFPSMVALEITNVCNFQCIHCPYPRIVQRPDYIPRHMSWEVFKKIADEIGKFKDTIVRFICDGEPMCHPRFLDMVRYMKRLGVFPVCMTTNGYFLGKKEAEILLTSCDVIEISLDALTKSTYEKIRKGGNFERVVGNIHNLIALRNVLKSKTKIMVSIIDQPLAHSEIEGFKKYWGKRVDRVIIRELTSVGGLVDIRDNNQSDLETPKERWPCPQLWRRTYVNVDGFVEFCVDDWLDETIIGDARKNSIQEIWKSKEYQRLRSLHLSGKFDKIPHCQKCQDWSARKWDYNYFYALRQILT